MARPRKPTTILELTGALDKDPKRRRARRNEPRPSGEIGAPPDCLTADQAQAWRYIVHMAPPGVLKNSDRVILEITAGLLAQHRAGTIDTPERSQLLQCLSKIGFSPADRSKIAADPGENDDQWDLFAEQQEKGLVQ